MCGARTPGERSNELLNGWLSDFVLTRLPIPRDRCNDVDSQLHEWPLDGERHANQ